MASASFSHNTAPLTQRHPHHDRPLYTDWSSTLLPVSMTPHALLGPDWLGPSAAQPSCRAQLYNRMRYCCGGGALCTTDPRGSPEKVDAGAAAEGPAAGTPADGAVPEGAVPEGVWPWAAAAAAAAEVTSFSAWAAAPPPHTESAAQRIGGHQHSIGF